MVFKVLTHSFLLLHLPCSDWFNVTYSSLADWKTEPQCHVTPLKVSSWLIVRCPRPSGRSGGRVSEERVISSRLDTAVYEALCDFNCDHQKKPDMTLKGHVNI